ncbi:tetratricopeptide repeat protein [Colwellia psychrerythraea]|uniref:TPR domain protein n=1 Tax=Colwellia psychrerythraea (strain 34H / ATCC BAA-681) TaxID=167879 RepID=Q48AE6_COLP3|nr:hypothetical protein [Colwellia psychrerythraea]AAZ26151.1 TPR domain protein [Colwellia psychrerythraea 34H]
METISKEFKSKVSLFWEAFNKNDFESAKTQCNQMKKSFSDEANPHYLLGIIYFEEKRFDKSIIELKLALKKDSERKLGGYIYYVIGLNYSKNTFSNMENLNSIYDIELARNAFESALTYENFNESNITELSQIYRNKFKLIQLFQKGLKKFPTKTSFYIKLSAIYKKNGNISERESLLLDAKENIKSFHILFELGELYLEKSQYKCSREHFYLAEKLREGSGLEFAVQVMIGNTHVNEGNPNLANEYYINAFHKEKNSCNFWFGLFGILASSAETSFADLKNILEEMEVTSQLTIEEWYGEMPLYYGSNYFSFDFPIDEKHLINRLNLFKKQQRDTDILGKIELIKASLYEFSSEDTKYIKCLKSAINYFSQHSYDFIFNKLAARYDYLLSHLQEEGKSVNTLINEIVDYLEDDYSFRKEYIEYLPTIVTILFEEKKHKKIIEIKNIFTEKQIDKADIWFHVGYAFNELGRPKESKYAYECNIKINGECTSTHNNLALLLENEGKNSDAVAMFQKALMINVDDEKLQSNLQNALDKQKAKSLLTYKNEAIDKSFVGAVGLLKSETFFSMETLLNFIDRSKKENSFNDGILSIQDEMFPDLLRTNLVKSLELKNDWLIKNYIALTEEIDEYGIPYYQVNPYLEPEIVKLKRMTVESELPKEWTEGIGNITIFKLDELDYFSIKHKISKINKKFKPLVMRDFNELIFNHLVGNRKAVVVLSGSFVELLLTYYCEKKRIKAVEYTCKDSAKPKKKKLYDCVLFDLISFIEEKRIFGNDFFLLSNLSRVYRNFIHPGVELKNSLDKSKSDLCFISSLEILKKII